MAMIPNVQFDYLFDEWSEQIEQVCANTLEAAGQYAIEQARATTLFKHSEKFNEGIVAEKISSNVVEVTSKKDIFLEFGNGPGNGADGRIHPVNAKVLHFYIDGEEVFANSVAVHPPYPYMTNASIKTQEQIGTIFAEEFDKIMGG